MRNNKLNYIIVGTFVLAMLFGLIFSIAMLTGRTGAVDNYYAVYRNVTGVKFGTQVLYEGFPIGQVDKVTPVSDGAAMSFRVDFSVIKDWSIPQDSVAKIAAPGLLSAITLSLSAGYSEKPLHPGSQVIGQEAANVFAVVSSVADQISLLAEKDLRPLLNNITPLLESITNTSDKFGKIIEGDASILVSDLVTLTGDLRDRVPRIADDIEQITSRINQSSKELSTLLTEENRKQIESLIGNMDTAAGNFTELSGNLDGLIKDLNGVVTDNKGNIEKSVVDVRYVTDSMARHIDALNQNMEATSRNMYEFSRQIRQNPGLLLGGTPPRDEAKTQ
ncbi:MAG: MCE family protein [Rhodospirillales bacterium]|nr:MCE family protein [Rhodospirillales bacterium]